MGWLEHFAAVALLVAGLPRLLSVSPARRAVALAHCSAAVAIALEIDEAEAWAAGAGLTAWLLAVQCMSVSTAAAALHALARRVAASPLGLSLQAVALCLPVLLVQGTLVYSAALAVPDQQLPLDLDRVVVETGGPPQLIALWAVTAASLVIAAVVTGPVFWAAWPALGVAARIAVGSGGLALGACAGDVVRAALPAVGGDRPSLSAAGLVLAAGGTIAVRLAEMLSPLKRWAAAQIALLRLQHLTKILIAAAPEWKGSEELGRWSLRSPAAFQLHFRLTTIRDAQYTLMGFVDASEIDQALEFAEAHLPTRPVREVYALADAAWLHLAIARRARGWTPVESELEFLAGPGATHQGPGPLKDEVAVLLAVAAAWKNPLASQFDSWLRTGAGSRPPSEVW